MNIKRLLFWGLILTTRLLNAQTDYRPGYIINYSGDTIFGHIDYRGDLLLASKCKFKTNENDIKEYSPTDIAAYRFTNSRYFISREINGSKVFLEYLIKGTVNIYYLRDKSGNNYYLDKEGASLTKIPYEEGIKYVEDKPSFYESKQHIGILYYYMQDAPELKSRIENTKRPEHRNLIKLAEDYHNIVCENESCIIFDKKMPSLQFSIEPLWGSVNYKNYDKSINEIGANIFLCAPLVNEKFYFKTGLFYQKFAEEENIELFKIPIQAQYLYSAHKIMPKVSVGVNYYIVNFASHKDYHYTFSLNTGLNLNLYEFLSLSANFNTEFIPILPALIFGDAEK